MMALARLSDYLIPLLLAGVSPRVSASNAPLARSIYTAVSRATSGGRIRSTMRRPSLLPSHYVTTCP